jgi:hypothetical protein
MAKEYSKETKSRINIDQVLNCSKGEDQHAFLGLRHRDGGADGERSEHRPGRART